MGGFEILEHTADVGVVATGDTLAEALAWLAKGMFSMIVDLEGVEPVTSSEVKVSSADPETLAVDWLNELLYVYESQGFVPKECRVSVDESGTSLTARCMGEPVDPERHALGTDVKAATYHRLEVRHDGEWRLRVFLDV